MSARLMANCSASARLSKSEACSCSLFSWSGLGRYWMSDWRRFSVNTVVSHRKMHFLRSG